LWCCHPLKTPRLRVPYFKVLNNVSGPKALTLEVCTAPSDLKIDWKRWGAMLPTFSKLFCGMSEPNKSTISGPQALLSNIKKRWSHGGSQGAAAPRQQWPPPREANNIAPFTTPTFVSYNIMFITLCYALVPPGQNSSFHKIAHRDSEWSVTGS